MTGAGIGATADSDGGGPIGFAFGTLRAVIDEIIKRNPDSEFAQPYKAQKAAIEANLTTHEILDIVKETNKIVKETYQTLIATQHKATLQKADEMIQKLDEMKPMIEETNKDLNGLVKQDEDRSKCDSEEKCKRCLGRYACVKATSRVVVRRQRRLQQQQQQQRLTTTTTATMTTTTTAEKLLCRKAVWESNPTNGIQKYENPDKFCGQADRHCYVLNCTIVLDSPAFDGGFFGYRAEWGCIESKASLLANFNQSDGWKGKQFIGSTCNPFIGAKHADMSNHNIFVPTFNTCGHFWMGNQQKNVTVCQKHEHYCYAVNCTLALAAGKSGVMQPEHYVLTKWGCTDNKKSAGIGLKESEAKQLIGQNDSIRYQSHVCSGQVGKANVSMSNARFEVPAPPKLCKKAYLSKKLGYNDSFGMSCGQSEHYCYVLNCSSSAKGHNQREVTTEWGCTDSDYTTDDFRLGKATNRNKEIMEWGCTSNMTQLYRQKVDEFGFELYKRCQFHAGPSNEEITIKELGSFII
uniref:Ricin B-type lectin domain-containing protein n=1 Tax=Globodera pallida TaxID=36090 RepID=A0A183BN09_GLOPA